MSMLADPIDDTAERLAAFEAALPDALPDRIIDSGFTPAGLRSSAELAKGCINVVIAREYDYGEAFGLIASDGVTELLLICHLQVDELESCSRSALATAVRAAELALLAEIKSLCRTPVAGQSLRLESCELSRQLEAPMGWLVATVTLRPPAASTN